MAFVVYTNNKGKTLTHEQAYRLEQVKQGRVKGTPQQQAYARRVKKIYFGKQHEPVVDHTKFKWLD